jgi:serine/threonine-protein kinase RsbW
MIDLRERFVVVVSDAAPVASAAASANGGVKSETAEAVNGTDDAGLAIPAGFGLAVISGLADDVHVSSTGSGVSVRMSWPLAAAGRAG